MDNKIKILFVNNSYPVNTRSQRFINSLSKKYIVNVCAWNRQVDRIEKNNNYFIYNSREGYGNKIKKLMGLRKYYKFLKNIIKKNKPNIVIASFWDMLFLASKVKKNNDFILIYDNLDMPSAKNKFINKIIQLIEKNALKKTNGIIFASRFFEKFYNKYTMDKIIFENYPSKITVSNDTVINKWINERKIYKKSIGFLGVIRYYEILKNVIDAVKDLEINFYLFGNGPELNKLENYAKDINNVHFFGRYEYNQIVNIYNNIDILWAAYPSKDFNVKNAISNKFFESIIYNVPGIYSKNTKLGAYVEKNGLGFVVDEYDSNSIKKLIENLDDKKIIEKTKKLMSYEHVYWEEKEHLLFNFINKVR